MKFLQSTYLIILTYRKPEQAMSVLKRIISILDLELNAEKSGVTTAREGFDFLGFNFIRKLNAFKNREISYIYPSRKSVDRFREKVTVLLNKWLVHVKPIGVAIRQLNSLTVGWYNYYSHTNASGIFKRLQMFINLKMVKYYCYTHKIRGSSSDADKYRKIEKLGVIPLKGKILYAPNPCCLR